MKTGPGWLCQPLCAPGLKTMLCTAMSTAGIALMSTCQSRAMRFTLKFGSFGSRNVARASKVDVEPLPRVKDGASAAGSFPRGAVDSLVSVQAATEIMARKYRRQLLCSDM